MRPSLSGRRVPADAGSEDANGKNVGFFFEAGAS